MILATLFVLKILFKSRSRCIFYQRSKSIILEDHGGILTIGWRLSRSTLFKDIALLFIFADITPTLPRIKVVLFDHDFFRLVTFFMIKLIFLRSRMPISRSIPYFLKIARAFLRSKSRFSIATFDFYQFSPRALF